MAKFRQFALYFIGALFAAYAFFQLASINTLAIYLLNDIANKSSLINNSSMFYLLFDAIGLIPAGLFLDRISLKYLMPVAILLLVFGTILLANAHTTAIIYLGRCVQGTAHSFAFLMGFKIARYCFTKKHLAIAMSMVVTIAMLGGFIAQAPFNSLILIIGWRKAMWLNIGFGAMLAILAIIALKNIKHQYQEGLSVKALTLQLISAIKIPTNFLMGLVIGLLSTPILFIGSSVGDVYLIKMMHASITQASIINSLLFVATIIGMPLFGILGDKYRLLSVLGVSILVSILIGIAICFTHNSNIYLQGVLFFALAFFSAAQTLGYVFITVTNVSDNQNTSMAFSNVIIMLVATLIPLISSLMALEKAIFLLPISLITSAIVLSLIWIIFSNRLNC